ncbi:nucleotidyltransferase domain-containing protein, partial [Agrobacterium sp. S2]|nr:nucleotidyltransferase domain-containing protein [Agrobacterium sp. S2]
MKMTVTSAFDTFDANLNLDPHERVQAQERHNQVRAVLERSGVIAGSFLQGSFARKTMLKPLKDVDIVVLLKPDSGLQGPDGPARAMQLFRDLVAEQWPTAVFDAGEKPSAKALRVEFDDLDFTIDLVPAFEGDGEWVLIGDRELRGWEPSNTRIQIRLVRERNGQTRKNFVHQVRMLKAVVKQQPEDEFE